MTILAKDHTKTSTGRRSIKAAIGIAGAGIMTVALGACASADQANAYTDALNAVQVKINSVVSATSSTEAYQAALEANLPAIKSDVQQLQAAEGNLSGEAQTIAQECTSDINAIVTGLETISAGVKAKDSNAVSAARETTNTEIQELKACIDKWNTNNGTTGS